MMIWQKCLFTPHLYSRFSMDVTVWTPNCCC